MKKILMIALLTCLCIGCSSDKDPVEKKISNADLYKEVEKYEAKMKTLDSYKIRKTEDVEVPVCGMETVENKKKNLNPKEYQIIKDGEDVAYFWKQKTEQEIQYQTVYYKNEKFYEEFSQAKGVVHPLNDWSKDINDTLIMDKVFREIDTTYFRVEVNKSEEFTTYSFVLDDPEGYNKKYATDRDFECGITGDYVSQKFEIKVNNDGYIIEEIVEEKVRYTYGENVHERLNVTKYEFYDFNVPNEINFYFL